MRKEVKFGKRIIFTECYDKHSCRVANLFFSLTGILDKDINSLMDKLKIPSNIILNFKKGDETLDGIYHVQCDGVSENYIIAIDIFTKQISISRNKEALRDLKLNLLDTFAHELAHHVYRNENKAAETASKFVRKVEKKI